MSRNPRRKYDVHTEATCIQCHDPISFDVAPSVGHPNDGTIRYKVCTLEPCGVELRESLEGEGGSS